MFMGNCYQGDQEKNLIFVKGNEGDEKIEPLSGKVTRNWALCFLGNNGQT